MNCSSKPGTTSTWPCRTTRLGPVSPTVAVSTGRPWNSTDETSTSIESSQPLTNPAAARIPSGAEVSYVISRSASARSSMRRPRLATRRTARPAGRRARTARRRRRQAEPAPRRTSGTPRRGACRARPPGLVGVLLGVGELLLGAPQSFSSHSDWSMSAASPASSTRISTRDVRLHLEVALALRQAHDVALGLVEAQLGRVQHGQHRLVVGQDADRPDRRSSSRSARPRR